MGKVFNHRAPRPSDRPNCDAAVSARRGDVPHSCSTARSIHFSSDRRTPGASKASPNSFSISGSASCEVFGDELNSFMMKVDVSRVAFQKNSQSFVTLKQNHPNQSHPVLVVPIAKVLKLKIRPHPQHHATAFAGGTPYEHERESIPPLSLTCPTVRRFPEH